MNASNTAKASQSALTPDMIDRACQLDSQIKDLVKELDSIKDLIKDAVHVGTVNGNLGQAQVVAVESKSIRLAELEDEDLCVLVRTADLETSLSKIEKLAKGALIELPAPKISTSYRITFKTR